MARRPQVGISSRLPLQSPWQGYQPDMAVSAVSPNGLETSKAMVVFSGVLTTDHGWRQAAPDELPLGYNDTATGFTDSAAATYSTGAIPAADATHAQPIRHITSFQRFTQSGGVQDLEAIAITVDRGGAVGANQETGHIFRLGASGNWVSAEFRARNGSGGVTAGSVPLSGGIDHWVDSAVYPLGVTGASLAAGVGTAADLFPVPEAVLVFTNYKDEVMYFPDGAGAGTYSDFLSYATQFRACGANAVANGEYYSGNATNFVSFRARSLAPFDGRMWYFNTVEGGNYFAVRLRRSKVGNPLIVWPGTEWERGVNRFNGVGAGFIDLEQMKTPGQRVLPLGDMLACYSKDGVAFVRRSGSVVAPFALQYVTLERGLLAPGAVVAIGPAAHFAILNDGWYVINANGTLNEVGVTSAGSLSKSPQEANYKWKEDFYTRINEASINAGHIQLGYDPQEQFVRISVPFGSGINFADVPGVNHPTADAVWIYDIKNDRVWPDDYSDVGGANQTPLCWGNINQAVGSAVTWAEVTAGTATPWGTIDDPGSWASISPSFGGTLPAHGDIRGYVYIHDDNLDTRDGNAVNWNFTTVSHNLGMNGAQQALLERIDLQYENAESSTSPIATVTVTAYDIDSGAGASAGTQETASVNLYRGNPGEMGQDYANFRVVGDHVKVAMSGSGGILIHSIDLELQPLEGRYRRVEGS